MNREPLAPRLFGRRVPLPLVAWLALVWVLLWGDLSAGNVLGGLAAGLVVSWLLPLPILDPGIRVRPVALVRFLVCFGWDMVASTARVVFWVAHPRPPPTMIVRVRLRTSSESMTVLIMIALSTVPGSLVLEAYEKDLVLHVLGIPGDIEGGVEGGVEGAVRADVAGLESRIVAAFGTRRDREELR
ncbi:multicomponent Na+:H+ antiporter subunit E [Nonomuraea solani]|uniref:Multicomponent Na+:H+ antiporter subunit E n=1 Tax=Nonomuraea solani TaxID=1144553 RepID=A0A1H6EJL7_9ACTN|nr:Na+/H+ antiporter subunit E [Nonomuraea solani]SEG96904.1 multicomponent Na+:H+ antiporter subunit E [Nonomuraea solani]